ncbi:FAD-binding protein [Burkholderia cenocepacia]
MGEVEGKIFVDAGHMPTDYQVRQAVKLAALRLCTAAGVSGAVQHSAGMKDSKAIVTIDKGPDTSDLGIEDYGRVSAPAEPMPELASTCVIDRSQRFVT